MSGPEADILIGNALPLKNIPSGTTVHNIELRPGKGAQMARSAGCTSSVGGQGRRLRAAEAAFRRNPQGAGGLHGDDRPGRQHRSRERGHRQGGTQPLEGHSPHQPRRFDEPCRPSARRRRGQDLGRPSSGDPVGASRHAATRRATTSGPTHSSSAAGRSKGAGDELWHGQRKRVPLWTSI